MTDAWEMHPETGLNPGPVWRDRGVIIANLTARNQALEEMVAELELAALNLRDNYQGAHERERALRERLTEIAAADSVWDIVRDLRALAASPAVDATPEPTPADEPQAEHRATGGYWKQGDQRLTYCTCGAIVSADAEGSLLEAIRAHRDTTAAEPQAEGGA